MIGLLASALVLAAVAAFLVWWAHYRTERNTADEQINGQYAALRDALRRAGIEVYDDPKPKPHLHLEAADVLTPARHRHAAGRDKREEHA